MKPNSIVEIGALKIGNALPLTLIAGPCQLESRDHAFMMAGRLKEITARLKIGLVYKTSFDKANRTSLSGKRGLGLERALPVFADIRKEFGLPVLTDVHENHQCAELASVVDVLQIPAFLSRQTDLLLAAAKTGKVVNVKKGQFLAPWDRAWCFIRLQHAGERYAGSAGDGRNRLSGRLRCDPFGSAARRPGHVIGRRPPLRSGPRQGGCRGRRRWRLHRDA
jgi:2-dehydro-3-deoxyphosphooctonate aldolase (KDO 8-P synthase)